MNGHKNARLTALGRAELVHRIVDLGQSAIQVAAARVQSQIVMERIKPDAPLPVGYG